jgi:hypothetical protein
MLNWLADLVDVDHYAVPVVGPRVWWAGPLNVEALALASVQCALTAANALSSEHPTEVRAELVAANFDSITHLRVSGRKPSMFAAMSGYFRCSDGWLRTHANFPHHAAALSQAFAVTDRGALADALSELPVVEAETAIRAAGGVAARLRTRVEWESSPQGRAVATEPWIRFRPGDREQRPRLDRLRVLDFTRVLAGPTATKFLASLGADVLRIDPPRMPELLDQHIDTGAGKRSATADLTDPATLKLVRQLAASADIFMLGTGQARWPASVWILTSCTPNIPISRSSTSTHGAFAAHGAANEASIRSFRRQRGSAMHIATPTARRARCRCRRWTTRPAMAPQPPRSRCSNAAASPTCRSPAPPTNCSRYPPRTGPRSSSTCR